MDVFRDFFAFIGRLVIGVILLVAGLQQFQSGIPATAAQFGSWGVPAPQISAWVAALVEVVGGVGLILGLLLPVFGILIALEMAGLILFVTLPQYGLLGVPTYGLAAGGAAALTLGFNGGRWSVDQGLFGRTEGRHAQEVPQK
jgi:putative oxidoreductase